MTGREAFGMTIPLLVDSKGEKFGKSTGGGSLWLDQVKTSAYDLYQYLINVQDSEVEDLLYRITFVPIDQIEKVMREHLIAPQERLAQKLLASTVVEMVHGADSLRSCQGSTTAFFSNELSSVFSMNETQFAEHFAYTQKVEVEIVKRNSSHTSNVLTYSSLIVKSGLRKSRGEAKRVIQQSGCQVNGRQIESDEQIDLGRDLLHNKYLVLKVGKKNYALLFFP